MMVVVVHTVNCHYHNTTCFFPSYNHVTKIWWWSTGCSHVVVVLEPLRDYDPSAGFRCFLLPPIWLKKKKLRDTQICGKNPCWCLSIVSLEASWSQWFWFHLHQVCQDRMRGGFSYNIMRHHCGSLVKEQWLKLASDFWRIWTITPPKIQQDVDHWSAPIHNLKENWDVFNIFSPCHCRHCLRLMPVDASWCPRADELNPQSPPSWQHVPLVVHVTSQSMESAGCALCVRDEIPNLFGKRHSLWTFRVSFILIPNNSMSFQKKIRRWPKMGKQDVKNCKDLWWKQGEVMETRNSVVSIFSLPLNHSYVEGLSVITL